jgi:hypothetical protein
MNNVMKLKFTYILLLSLFLFSCGTRDFQKEIENLNGYWQIESVTFPDGTEKKFSISTTVDYIEVEENDKGYRKKVNPKLDGSFVTNNSKEFFTLETSEKEMFLHYKTEFDTWTENVVKAEKYKLVIKNKDDKVYRYKRFTKFEFSEK